MRYLAFVLLCLGTVSADEIKPVPDPISSKIHLPTMPVLVEPNEPTPQPLPGPPLPISIISGDQWYVIESSVPLIVLASPDGFVSIEPSEGPIKVRGVFADGTGKVETRTFSQPYVYFVNAKASGKVELLVIPQGVTSEADIIRQPLTVTVGPRPPPIPPEPPTPDPDDPPGPPIPGKENRVLIIYESSDLPKYPPAQTAVFAAASLREYLAKKCVKGPDGKTPEYRIWDKDVDTVNVSTVWKDAMKLQRQSLPWIIVSNGSTGFSGPLPTDVDSTVTLLKKYLGD